MVETCKLRGVFAAFAELGVAAEPVVYSDDAVDAVRGQVAALDGLLVWVNPIEQGLDRSTLDPLLRDAAAAGVYVSAHPDAIRRMGTKEVLVDTRSMSWSADTHVYRSVDEMGPPKRVLVVEAKSENLEYLRALIESAGHECDAVSSVGEAIQRLSATAFDLVLLDLVLHDAEGIEVARHILERGLTTPVVAISGLLDRASGSPEAHGTAPRPYSAREILDAIRNS